MHETPEPQRQRTTNRRLTQTSLDDNRTRKVVAERNAAVRRWIEDDDDVDSACRGID
jgi:hypothetical protein